MASPSGRANFPIDPRYCSILVAPDGRLHLTNIKTKVCYWSSIITDKDNRNSNNRVYSAFHGKSVSDYVDAVVDAGGSIRLFQHEADKSPKVIPWVSTGFIERYLKARYGEQIVLKPTSKDTMLDMNNGGPVKADKNFIRIKNTKFEIFTGLWRLQFVRYKAEFVLEHKDDVRPIRVNITHDWNAFQQLYLKLSVKSNRISHDLWVSTRLIYPIIKTTPMNQKLSCGLMGGSYNVFVKSYPVDFILPKFWYQEGGLISSNHTPKFYGFTVDHQKMHLVFELCKSSLYDYIFTKGRSLSGKEVLCRNECLSANSLRKLMRTFLEGIRYLKKNKIQHKKLSLWNFVVTDDECVKIVGFRQLEEYVRDVKEENSSELEVGEAQKLSKVIASFYGKPDTLLCEESFEAKVLTEVDVDDNFPEVRYLIKWMQDPISPPDIDEIAAYINGWDVAKKIRFIKDVCALLEAFAKDNLSGRLVKTMFSERAFYFKINANWKNNWRNLVPASVLVQLEEPDKTEVKAFHEVGKDGKASYYHGASPFQLLRFIRNLLTHFHFISNGKKLDSNGSEWLGSCPEQLLKSFHLCFPTFLVDLYEFFRLELKRTQRKKRLGPYFA